MTHDGQFPGVRDMTDNAFSDAFAALVAQHHGVELLLGITVLAHQDELRARYPTTAGGRSSTGRRRPRLRRRR
jgi:hypothetical protein